jgi:predicted metal-dependent phosphoesterase TrpH
VIDLHTHTTASDGRCSPAELVARARTAGVTVLSVTDHDTVAACDDVGAACRSAGIAFVPGIEITAVRDGIDVHVLGYFVDHHAATLHAFLAEQRRRRVDRIRAMIDRLADCGMHLDADAILRPVVDDDRKAAGRPWIARALVAGGHVADVSEAFDRWLGRGRPAFVPRLAAAPAEVFDRIHDAGGVASAAHPGLLARDEWLADFARDGVDAFEAYHTEHDAAQTTHYLALADRYGVLVTGGSDFHGDAAHGGEPGSISLPQDAYERLHQRRSRWDGAASSR